MASILVEAPGQQTEPQGTEDGVALHRDLATL
jgi:hypothetical protein